MMNNSSRVRVTVLLCSAIHTFSPFVNTPSNETCLLCISPWFATSKDGKNKIELSSLSYSTH